jgi:F-type H+-transporting ATPase subunit b
LSVDWFTVLAQVLNFLILVALLRRFLYRPILGAMRERQDRIARQVREAEEERREAEREREACRAERRDLEASRERLLAEARDEVEARRRELEAEARREVEETRRRWHAAVEKEKEVLLQEIRERTEGQVLALTAQVLDALAGEELERRIVERFLERLEKDRDAWPATAPGERVTVRSAFELPEPLQERVRQALAGRDGGSGEPAEVEFHVDPALIGGIEARRRGHKLAWSLRDFLEGVEERLAP